MNERAIEFMENIFYRGNGNKYFDDGKYEFRNILEHSKRVNSWAMRINALEHGDEEIVFISSLFHDIGKVYNNDHYEHAVKSSEICSEYLKTIHISEEKKNRILHTIEIHPYKEDDLELTIEDRIIMDADLLDEVGVTTLVWDSMATALESHPSYEKVFERSFKYFHKVSSKSKYLKTNTGRRYYDERLHVLNECICNFKYEINYCKEDFNI